MPFPIPLAVICSPNHIRKTVAPVKVIIVSAPPQPSNHDRYILWTKRNITKPVIEQSEAVEFLFKRNYKLNEDYEPYQAIGLSKEIKRNEGIVDITEDTTTQFNNVFSNNDKNILRRRSIHSMVHTPETLQNNQPNMELSYNFDSSFDMRHRATTVPIPNTPPINQYPMHRPMLKPSAPPMSHNVVYPEHSSPDCGERTSDDYYV